MFQVAYKFKLFAGQENFFILKASSYSNSNFIKTLLVKSFALECFLGLVLLELDDGGSDREESVSSGMDWNLPEKLFDGDRERK